MGAAIPRMEGMQKQARELIAKLDSPHADQVYIGKDFTKADLIRVIRQMANVA